MNKNSFIKILRIARIEYYKWIVNPRMIIAASMIVFVWTFAVSPLMEISREMNSPLNTLEPFIAILNSRVLCLVTPSVFLFLISDYPKLDRKSLFMLIRIKKTEWVWGQFLFFLFSAFTYLSSILIFSIIVNISNSFFINGWSLVITRYGIYFPEKASSFAATLITPELYNQIAPFQALFSGFALSFLYIVLIAMILLLFYVINLRKFGVTAAVSIIALGSALGIIKASGMWFFPMPHTMISLHYTKHFKEPIMSIRNSFLYFVIIILILLIICLFRVKYTDFLSIDDNE